jgi:hypothetical protein
MLPLLLAVGVPHGKRVALKRLLNALQPAKAQRSGVERGQPLPLRLLQAKLRLRQPPVLLLLQAAAAQ